MVQRLSHMTRSPTRHSWRETKRGWGAEGVSSPISLRPSPTRPPMTWLAMLGGEGDQLLDQLAALLDRPADDMAGMAGEVEPLAARAGMAADEALPHRREPGEHLGVEIGEADQAARADDAVLGDEAVEAGLHP